MRQTRLGSFIESCANTAVGLVVALAAMHIIVWAHDIPMSFDQNVIVTGWMTVVSVARSYVLRRFFEWHLRRKAR